MAAIAMMIHSHTAIVAATRRAIVMMRRAIPPTKMMTLPQPETIPMTSLRLREKEENNKSEAEVEAEVNGEDVEGSDVVVDTNH